MSTLNIETPFNIDLEFTTASLLKRVGAVMLDMFVLILYMLLIYRFVIINFDMGKKLNELVMMMSISILPFIYFPATEIFFNGQTPGKRLLGLKVMDKEGKEPTISQYLLRWLMGPGNYTVFLLPYVIVTSAMAAFSMVMFSLLVIGIFYLPDFICSAITVKNQRIADLASGTVVIDVKKKMDFSETIFLEIHDENAVAKYPQVLQLSDKDINGIKNLLKKNAKTKVEIQYRNKIVLRIKEVIHITEEHYDDVDFLEQLLRDYNYLTQRK
ncbi:MAG: RDD family protein [Chitinophagaceae bacterium]|jgi:uncharacterized RDD family membrane protein YckC